MAESYPTIITFKPSRYLLHVLHPSLSHSRTFRTHHTCNCASCISTHLLAASALFIPQVNVEIPPHYHTRVPCIPQHAASIHVQMDTFTFSASCCPSCYSLQFSDQGVYWDLSLAPVMWCLFIYHPDLYTSPHRFNHTQSSDSYTHCYHQWIMEFLERDNSIHSWLFNS
jgi:hypothetical protein